MILHKPGSIVEYVLTDDLARPEEEQGVVEIKVPDEASLRRLLALKPGGSLDSIEVARMKFGAFVANVRNVRFADGSPVELRRDPSGAFTRECMVELHGLIDDLDRFADLCTKVTDRERKNSSSPSR